MTAAAPAIRYNPTPGALLHICARGGANTLPGSPRRGGSTTAATRSDGDEPTSAKKLANRGPYGKYDRRLDFRVSIGTSPAYRPKNTDQPKGPPAIGEGGTYSMKFG